MADNVLHPITGTGTADVTQRTFDLGSGVQAPAVVLIDETTGAAVGGTTAEGLKVNANHNGTAATATWTSATPDESTLSITTVGYSGAVLYINGDGGGVSGGVVILEQSFDGGTTWADPDVLIMDPNFTDNGFILQNPSGISLIPFSGIQKILYVPTLGATNVRLRLSTVITGSESFALRLYATTVPVIDLNVARLLSTISTNTSSSIRTVTGLIDHDADAATVDPVLIGGYSSATAPADVSANNEAVRAWFLRNGAQAVVLTAGGALIGGDAANGVDTDVTRIPGQQVLGTDVYTEAASIGITLGAVRRDADTTLVNTTNEFSPLQVDALGRLKCEVFSGETLPVSGTVTANAGTGPFPVSDNASSLTVDAPLATPVNVQIGNATLAAGVIDETGASAVDALAVGGGTAHDAVDSGNPVKVGGVAVSGSATPTSVASADRTRWIFNQHGIPYVMSGHPNLITREYDFGTAAQTDVNLAAAVVAADERIYVTRFEALCDNANTVAVSVRAGFGTANVPSASSTGVSGMIASHPGIAAGSGIICGGSGGLIAVGGAGEEPRITTTAATTGNLHVVISYYLIDETP